MTPTTPGEWSEAIMAATAVRHSIPSEWCFEDGLSELSHAGYRQVVEFSPEDLVVTVQAGITLDTLQQVLGTERRRLPVGGSPMPLGDWTVAELLSINPPHTDEFERGGWRDWLLGAKLLMGDGRIVKIGSRAVKNVAGYDVQKLIVGCRGTLAVVLEATLLVGPSEDASDGHVALASVGTMMADAPWHLQRVSLTDGPALAEAARAVPHAYHEETATLWARTPEPLPRFAGDWVMRPGALVPDTAGEAKLWRRAKEQLDPRGVLNPGYLRF